MTQITVMQPANRLKRFFPQRILVGIPQGVRIITQTAPQILLFYTVFNLFIHRVTGRLGVYLILSPLDKK